MEMTNKDGHIYITPKDGKYTHVIIFLHGLGDYPQSYIGFFQENDLIPKNISVKIILLKAPLRKYQTSWFTISTFPMDSKDCYTFKEAQEVSKIVEKIIEEEAKSLNGKYENIIIGGFSQGACMSLYIGLTYDHLLGGVISLSGFVFPELENLKKNKELNIFNAHGDVDNVILNQFNLDTLKMIQDYKGLNNFIYHNLGHNINGKEMQDLQSFLKKILNINK